MSDPRDDLAALVASRRGVTARVNDNDRWVADAILAAGWRSPGTTFDVCGHGRRPTESCILCERVIQ